MSAETRPVPVRTMPITPTIGRVKTEGGGIGHSPAVGHPGLDGVNNSPGRGLKMAALTSLMTPEMARYIISFRQTLKFKKKSFSYFKN